ncbi:UNVERIFIED_CONTAM: hypothetical protein Sradi_0167700 [Sesamum radiatum]|uniref:Reverse transcriptase Ty1/copia-type domain-containing protein n=1 Tax=Sesamum radiatum TaxID=300843 RepID=A0AAW2VZU0_SESRA
MAKSIRILLAIAAWYDYEIWQMDVKMAFLNGFMRKRSSWISGRRIEGLSSPKVLRPHKQASEVGTHILKSYGFMISSRTTMILVYTRRSVGALLRTLYFISMTSYSLGNDVKMLGHIKAWLSTQFSMKDMGEASYILGIKIYRDRSRRMLGLTQSSYIEKVLKRFRMNTQKRVLPWNYGPSQGALMLSHAQALSHALSNEADIRRAPGFSRTFLST